MEADIGQDDYNILYPVICIRRVKLRSATSVLRTRNELTLCAEDENLFQERNFYQVDHRQEERKFFKDNSMYLFYSRTPMKYYEIYTSNAEILGFRHLFVF
jgi:hypothetical protein